MRPTAGAIVVLMLVFGACGGDSDEGSGGEAGETQGPSASTEEFCDATRTVVELGEVDAIPPELGTMVEAAPEEIKDSAETVQAGFELAFETGDPSAIETVEFQEAAREIREYALANCEGLTDESGE